MWNARYDDVRATESRLSDFLLRTSASFIEMVHSFEIKKQRLPNWTVPEDELLCRSWTAVAKETTTGVHPSAQNTFWCRIHALYTSQQEALGITVVRDPEQLENRFQLIRSRVGKFCGYIAKEMEKRPKTVDDAYNEAVRLYNKFETGPAFTLKHCYDILKNDPKWLDQLRSKDKGKGKRRTTDEDEEFDVQSVEGTLEQSSVQGSSGVPSSSNVQISDQQLFSRLTSPLTSSPPAKRFRTVQHTQDVAHPIDEQLRFLQEHHLQTEAKLVKELERKNDLLTLTLQPHDDDDEEIVALFRLMRRNVTLKLLKRMQDEAHQNKDNEDAYN